MNVPTLELELLKEHSDALQALANDCCDNPQLWEKVDADPRTVFADRSLPFPVGPDVRVVRNTDEVFFLTMPPDPNTTLSDGMLEGVAGGGSFGTPDTHPNNCASTSSTIPSCLGTYGCATGN